jgi:hypothetical protein
MKDVIGAGAVFERSPPALPTNPTGAQGTAGAAHLRVSLVTCSASYFEGSAYIKITGRKNSIFKPAIFMHFQVAAYSGLMISDFSLFFNEDSATLSRWA